MKRIPPSYSYSRPSNAKWVKSEKDAIHTLTFDSERVSPKDMTQTFSPFLAEIFKLSGPARDAYAREEGMRRAWRESQWPWIERLLVHLENRNQKLFDKEARLEAGSPHAKSWVTRLSLLYTLHEQAFDNFTLVRMPAISRVKQRIALARSISPNLYDELAKSFATSSRIEKIWHEIKKIRKKFLSRYPSIGPLLKSLLYWEKQPKKLSEFVLPDKAFDDLRQLYVDCLETLCRLMVVAMGLEAIIHHRTVNIPAKKGHMSLWEFEAMPNGIKHTILDQYPIHDLFVPAIDHNLRNGLGHHSAKYSPATDQVIYYKQDGPSLLEIKLSYTEFVHKVLVVYSALELAALYFNDLHIRACELESIAPVARPV